MMRTWHRTAVQDYTRRFELPNTSLTKTQDRHPTSLTIVVRLLLLLLLLLLLHDLYSANFISSFHYNMLLLKNYKVNRNTLCGTWYLPRSHVYNERTVPIIMAGCMEHAQNGYISTSGLKSDGTIVFLDSDFLNVAKITAIRVHLRQI